MSESESVQPQQRVTVPLDDTNMNNTSITPPANGDPGPNDSIISISTSTSTMTSSTTKNADDDDNSTELSSDIIESHTDNSTPAKTRPTSLSIVSSTFNAATSHAADSVQTPVSATPVNTHAFPQSKSFDNTTALVNDGGTNMASQPQSPTPLSPTTSVHLIPVPPSRPSSHRLVDYFLVIGRKNDPAESLKPMRRLSRSNSQTIEPINDLLVLTGNKEIEAMSDDCAKVTDFSNNEVNVNGGGFMRTPVFIAESRRPKPKPSGGLLAPITGIDIIYSDKKEVPKPGYTLVSGNLNKGAFNRTVNLCIERDLTKSPIIDVRIILVNERNDKESGNNDSNGNNETAQDLCPSDYTLIDKVIANYRSKDYYLCYKLAVRRAVEYQAYESFVLDRYPPADHFDQPLESEGVAMLCFPRGMILTNEMLMPTFMTFVITQADGSEMYGAALIFYELLTADSGVDLSSVLIQPKSPSSTFTSPTSKLKSLASPSSNGSGGGAGQLWCPKCLCLLSHHPYYDVYKTFLNQLYRIAVSPSSLPIERYVANFFYDVPVPTPLYPVIRFTMGHEKMTLTLRSRLGLPHQHVSLMPLFKCLSVSNILTIFEHVLAEGKTVLVSSSYTLLTPVAEAIRALLFPLKWQCVFIPILPTNLAYTIRAPVPFIVGLHRSFLDEIKVPQEVLQVDLDRNRIVYPSMNNLDPDAEKAVVPLPVSLKDQLVNHLSSFIDIYRPPDEHSNNELESYTAPLESSDEQLTSYQELGIRLAFLRVIVRFLGDYRRYCILRAEDSHDGGDDGGELFDLDRLFDRKSFLASFPPSLVEFARQMTETQGFSDFILNRISFTNRMDELIFFDYCCALTREEPKKDTTSAVGANPVSEKPGLARSNTTTAISGVIDNEKKRDRFSRTMRSSADMTNSVTIPSTAQSQGQSQSQSDQYKIGSLTIEKIEEWQSFYPSLTPFLYAPGHEKPYVAPPVNEDDCPPVIDNATFPKLDVAKFPVSARELQERQEQYSVYYTALQKQIEKEKKAAKAATIHGRETLKSQHSTPVQSPVKPKPSLSLSDNLPSSPKNFKDTINSCSAAFAFRSSLHELQSSREKIVSSLFTILNSLTARVAKSGLEDKKSFNMACTVYAMWFQLFVSECEKERAKRVEAQRQVKFLSVTDSDSDPLSLAHDTRDDAFTPASSIVKLLPDTELSLTAADLLSIYTELHTMVYKGSVLPNEMILQDISLFCLRAGLTQEFQELYRLLATSVPFPTTGFYVTLARIGVSVLPGQPCSITNIVDRLKAEHALSANSQYEFPLTIETHCVCAKCDYTFSGEEIIAGWTMGAIVNMPCPCPLCETLNQPSLLVRFAGRESALRVDYHKPSALHKTLTSLIEKTKQSQSVDSHGDVVDLGDSGTVDLFNASGNINTVGHHDLLLFIKQNPEFFWNCFWNFQSRGLSNEDYGQLPVHFFFNEAANAPSYEQPNYRFVSKPYQPFRLVQEGVAMSETQELAQSQSVTSGFTVNSAQSSRSVSPTLQAHQALSEQMRLELIKTSADDGFSASASPINGHRQINSEGDLSTTGASSVGEGELSTTGELNPSTENSPITSGAVANDRPASLTLNAEAEDGKRSPLATPATAISGISGGYTSRRQIKSWSGIIAIMQPSTSTLSTDTSVSTKPSYVPRAVHEILRARKSRHGWTQEQRDSDPEAQLFQSSMYRSLALLLTDTTDPVGFAAEYRSAINSLDALVEAHKKAVEAVDAQIALLTKNNEKKDKDNKEKENISGLKSPTATSASAAGAGPSGDSAAASSGATQPIPIVRSPSSTFSSLSQASPSTSPLPSSLDPEAQMLIDAQRKKRSQLCATLQEAISLRNEIHERDQSPIMKYIYCLPAIRKLFGHDSSVINTKKSATTPNPTAGTSTTDSHHAYASLVEDVLLNEVPELFDVLSQSSQNPYYTLDAFNKFCQAFVSAQERDREAQAKQAALAASLSSAAAALNITIPALPAKSTKPQQSLAYRYCTFWQTARRWKIGYEKQERQRTMAIKKDQQDMIQDVLYDTAKAIYLEYLVPVVGSNATASTTIDTVPTVSGLEFEMTVFQHFQQLLGEITTTNTGTPINRPATAQSLTSSPPVPAPSTPTHASTKSASTASPPRRRVPKTLFDELLEISLHWLQSHVFEPWVHEVKETEHSITPALNSLGMISGNVGLHNHSSGTAAGSATKAKQSTTPSGKPPAAPLKLAGKSGSALNLTTKK